MREESRWKKNRVVRGGNSIAKWQNAEEGLQMELLSEYLITFRIPQVIGEEFDRQVEKRRKGPANGVVERVFDYLSYSSVRSQGGETSKRALRMKFFFSEYLIIFRIPRGMGNSIKK